LDLQRQFCIATQESGCRSYGDVEDQGVDFSYKRKRKPKGQSRMDSPEIQVTPGTRHRQHWAQDAGNNGHKTQDENKQNRKHNTR